MSIPASLADAEERRQQLTLEIQGIQAQLGDKQRTDESGRRLEAQEYWTWKKRAQHALNQKLDELRQLKAWIKENRPPLADGVQRSAENPEAVLALRELYVILKNLQAEDVDLDPHELNKIDAAGLLLDRLGINRSKGRHDQNQDHPSTSTDRSS